MGIGRTIVRQLPWLALLACCGPLGCATLAPPPPPPSAPPDPLVTAILKQDKRDKKGGLTPVDADVVLEEVPVHTPVAQARAIMESHGFTVWGAVPDGFDTYLSCKLYKPKGPSTADKISVRLYYENKKVTSARVTIEYDVPHTEHGWWPAF